MAGGDWPSVAYIDFSPVIDVLVRCLSTLFFFRQVVGGNWAGALVSVSFVSSFRKALKPTLFLFLALRICVELLGGSSVDRRFQLTLTMAFESTTGVC